MYYLFLNIFYGFYISHVFIFRSLDVGPMEMVVGHELTLTYILDA